MNKIIIIFLSVFALNFSLMAQDHSGHNHAQHDHSHQGHSHDGHSHQKPAKATQSKTQKGHSHQGHSHDGHDHSGHSHAGHNHGKGQKAAGHAGHGHGDHHNPNGCPHKEHKFSPIETAFHHIGDANIWAIGPWSFNLPCILYAPGKGWSVFSSSKFEKFGTHGDGAKAVDGYVLYQGRVKRMTGNAPQGVVPVCFDHAVEKNSKGKDKDIYMASANGRSYRLDSPSTADGGLFGGGITSFYDFSITKNVLTMILIALFLFFVFRGMAKKYAANEGKAPSGVQGLLEPVFTFIQDDVAKPFLGHKWEKYLPFLMSLFFFILALNLFGQIPFFGNVNVTGNLSFTLVLAVIAFLVVNLSGNKHYWEHIFWMPGVPAWVKTILTPVEFAGMFIKPITLMLRLFANITAGHIVIVIFVCLIFIFGKFGQLAEPLAGPSYGAAIASVALGLFMMAIELIVAFIQAFVFTILTASYIGAATEEAEHH